MKADIKTQDFWNNYRKEEIKDEKDLFFQVGKTVNKKPVSQQIFQLTLNEIIRKLELQQTDVLIDVCCGNGLITYELANIVKEIIGIDFTQHLIEAANKYKKSININYIQADAFAFDEFIDKRNIPNKLLMNAALSYFSPQQLHFILAKMQNLSQGKAFRCLFSEVPNDALKWNFYDTEERKQFYLANKDNDNFNNGMGRWWQEEEVAQVCKTLNLQFLVENQKSELADYRMDIIIWN